MNFRCLMRLFIVASVVLAVAGQTQYEFESLGSGWCRAPDCSATQADPCLVNGFYKDQSGMDECVSMCHNFPDCVGFALSDNDYSVPNRCFVYTSLDVEQTPTGWTSFSLGQHYAIGYASGYAGVECFERIGDGDDCDPDPCMNGECIDKMFAYECSCEPGFEGTLCESEIDECATEPCGPGICTDFLDAYVCDCTGTGMIGENCDVYPPSMSPSSSSPSSAPSNIPSHAPSNSPSNAPSNSPSNAPSNSPSNAPSNSPSHAPSNSPSNAPSSSPSNAPSNSPSHAPSNSPSHVPSNSPSDAPSSSPSHVPSNSPSDAPSNSPSHAPSNSPSDAPSNSPSHAPSNSPSHAPSESPSFSPVVFDDCAAEPCVHGLCNDLVGGFHCICQSGYEGELCDQNVNECEIGTHNCDQNASCQDTDGSFDCECNGGYLGDGETCLQINWCNTADCGRGDCVNHGFGYECVCDEGFTGDHCDEKIDWCENVSCNHGKCYNQVDGYECVCTEGYTGDNCEYNIDDCASDPCVYGECDDLTNGYRCMCDSGFAGKHCEHEVTTNCFVDDECLASGSSSCFDSPTGYECHKYISKSSSGQYCVKIESGPYNWDAGYLSVAIVDGTNTDMEAFDDFFDDDEIVFEACYSFPVSVKLWNERVNGWHGSVQFSRNGGNTWTTGFCNEGCGTISEGIATNRLIVDSNSIGAPVSGSAFCLNGETCVIESTTRDYCVKLQTGDNWWHDGWLSLSVDYGRGYETVIDQDYFDEEEEIGPFCYIYPIDVKVTNSRNNAWGGSIEFSQDGGLTYSAGFCAEGCADVDYEVAIETIAVDGNSDSQNMANVACINEAECIIVSSPHYRCARFSTGSSSMSEGRLLISVHDSRFGRVMTDVWTDTDLWEPNSEFEYCSPGIFSIEVENPVNANDWLGAIEFSFEGGKHNTFFPGICNQGCTYDSPNVELMTDHFQLGDGSEQSSTTAWCDDQRCTIEWARDDYTHMGEGRCLKNGGAVNGVRVENSSDAECRFGCQSLGVMCNGYSISANGQCYIHLIVSTNVLESEYMLPGWPVTDYSQENYSITGTTGWSGADCFKKVY